VQNSACDVDRVKQHNFFQHLAQAELSKALANGQKRVLTPSALVFAEHDYLYALHL
jgi:hypothetical protein